MPKDDRLIVRTDPAMKARLVAIAERECEGNISQATRRVIYLGLRAIDLHIEQLATAEQSMQYSIPAHSHTDDVGDDPDTAPEPVMA